jgi:hypothetical protein
MIYLSFTTATNAAGAAAISLLLIPANVPRAHQDEVDELISAERHQHEGESPQHRLAHARALYEVLEETINVVMLDKELYRCDGV